MKGSFSKYFYIYRMQILKSFNYKFTVYGNIITQTIIMIASAFFWKALYRGKDAVMGVSVDTMLTYTVVSSMISILLMTNVERRIQMSVRKGTIAVDMMRPINVFRGFFAEDLGNMTALIFQNLLPVLVIGTIFIGFPTPSSTGNFFLFLVSLILAYMINWTMAALFGMLAFSIVELDALIQVKKHLIRLLSGSIIPMWFMPLWFRNILECLPFVYLYQMPLNIYVGQYTNESLIKGLSIQAAWAVTLLLIYIVRQKRVGRKLMIQGG